MHCCTVPRNYYCLSICKLIFVTKTFYGVASNKGQELRICYGLPWKHIIVVQTFSLSQLVWIFVYQMVCLAALFLAICS
jgi:hypothetical protein